MKKPAALRAGRPLRRQALALDGGNENSLRWRRTLHRMGPLALLFLCACRAPASPAPEPPPNVVLILGDDQAWSDHGFLGHAAIETPQLDRLAAAGLVYARGYVPSSLCCPSLASLITGLTPHVHRITGNEPPRPRGTKETDPGYQAQNEVMDGFIEQVPTLPRLLGEAGYLSMQTGKWWHGGFERGGFTHGMTHGDPARGGRHGDEGLAIGREGLGPVRDFLAHAVDQQAPFFLWYAPFLPHRPHNPPARLLEKYRSRTPSEHVAKYWAMCEWFDETCGQLLDLLDEMDLADDTVVVYLTDNGWIQREDAEGYAPRSKQSPYDGGLRTPIVLRWPGHITPERRDDVVMSTDLAPTLLKACGLPVPAAMRGVDLLDPDAVADRRTVYGEVFRHNAIDVNDPAANLRYRWCIDGGRDKLILPDPAHEPDGTVELFDVVADPWERHDLAGTRPERVMQLTALLDAWWKPDPLVHAEDPRDRDH